MNDEDFEKKLHDLTGALHRPDPTPAWKADILARARREAAVIPMKRNLPPRWLMLGWAAAWAAVLVMNFTSTQDSISDYAVNKVKAAAGTTSPQGDAPTLLAFHQQLNQTLNLDLP